MTLIDLIFIAILGVSIVMFLYKLASIADQLMRLTDTDIEVAIKKANAEFNNRPRI